MIRRLIRLFAGLFLYGFTMAMLVESTLGLDPWDVFHEGVTKHVPLTFGQVVIATGAVVMLLWIPLRQKPGLGTISNIIVIGLAADAGLWVLPTPDGLVPRVALLVGGVVGNGLAGAMYIGADFGTGPRDGLWTGLVRRTGHSIRVWRTLVEVTVLVVGFLLGGTVGAGTVLYALTIGPLVQFFLELFPSAASRDEQRRVGIDQHLDRGEAFVGEPALAHRVDMSVDDGRPEGAGDEVVEHRDATRLEQIGQDVDALHDLADIDEQQ